MIEDEEIEDEEIEATLQRYSVKVAAADDVPQPIRWVSPLLDGADAARASRAGAARNGVYFLCLRELVVYVGQAVNVCARVGQHSGVKEFDRWFFAPVERRDLNDAEAALIRLLLPPLNSWRDGRGPLRLAVPHRKTERDAPAIAKLTRRRAFERFPTDSRRPDRQPREDVDHGEAYQAMVDARSAQ